MRVALMTALLLSGCVDFDALYRGSAADDLPTGGPMDLARTVEDLGTSSDSASPDLVPPVYWVTAYSAAGGAKPLRGLTGAGTAIYVVGDGGTLIQSNNRGGTWAIRTTGTGTNFSGVWASAADDAWIVGNGGNIYHYDGTTLTPATFVPNQNYGAVAGVNSQQVIAVGDDLNMGGQFRMMVKWQGTTHNLGQKQHGMWGMNNRLWSVGDNNIGGSYDINNQNWTKQTITASKSTIMFRAVWGSAENDVWAVGAEGNISHFAANPPFQLATTNSVVNLNGVWGLGPTNIWAVGDAGTILHYDGSSWQKWTKIQDIQPNEMLLAIWGNGTNLWTVSDKGNIYRYQ